MLSDKRRVLIAAFASLLLLGVSGAAGANEFTLTVVSQTNTTITFSYPQQSGYGYLYSANGTVVSRTNDPTKTTVKFSKANSYEVATIVKGTTGTYPVAPPPPPPAACADSQDNDGDGKIDYPADPGCSSASDTDETDPAPPPPPTGYPDDSNTGVPAGTTLTAYTGPSNVTTAGTVIDSKTIGCIQISAPGVIIRKSRVLCSSGTYAVYLDDRSITSSQTPLLIEDSEISCGDQKSGAAFGEADVILRRVDIQNCENGLDMNQNILVEDSYIHNLHNEGDNHMDGAQSGCGHWDPSYSGPSCAAGYAPGTLNITFRHNTIYAIDDADGSFGTSAIISNRTPNIDTNVLIDNNLLAGGAFTVYCPQDGAQGINWRITNNHFSTRFKSTVGFFGYATDCSNETQSGNVIHETGQSIFLP